MPLKRISPERLSGAVRARASWAVVHNGIAYLSGAVGRDPETGNPREGIVEQTKQAMENIKVILEEAGSTLDNIIKTGCYLSTMDDFVEFTKVWESYFPENYPARVCYQVGFNAGILVEIEVTAVVNS